MDFMFATAPIPAGTALPSKWRSLILSLIVQRRRQNTFHSKDLCEYRRPNSDIRTPRVPTPIQPRVRLPMSNTANEDASKPSFPFGSAGNLRDSASKCHGNRSELELERGSKCFWQQGGVQSNSMPARRFPGCTLAWPPPSCDDTCVSLYLVCTTLARQSAALNPSRPRRIRRDPWPSAAFY
jgi:hypothetical protein